MKPIAASVILDALDAAAARGAFPAFDNMNVDYISSRLAVYRGDDDWAVVFNSIAWADQSIMTIVEPRMNVHNDEGFWIAVALAERHRDALLALPDEIARFFPRGLPPECLTLDDWRHVDLSGGEKPSQSETFQMLASAIAAGDPSLYKPTGQPNTHWSSWLPK